MQENFSMKIRRMHILHIRTHARLVIAGRFCEMHDAYAACNAMQNIDEIIDIAIKYVRTFDVP